jgi:predicted enzyme related to lactoylglutathione lyase
MHGQLAHFAINADDLAATRAFYEALFGWEFTEYAPAFIRSTSPGPIGAIQQRRALLEEPTNAPEVTITVDDVDAAIASAERLGGRVVMPKTTIPGVGDLAFFADPSGNVIGAMSAPGA